MYAYINISTDHDLGEVDCGVDPLYDIDRSLFEYVRMELKHKLKDVRMCVCVGGGVVLL